MDTTKSSSGWCLYHISSNRLISHPPLRNDPSHLSCDSSFASLSLSLSHFHSDSMVLHFCLSQQDSFVFLSAWQGLYHFCGSVALTCLWLWLVMKSELTSSLHDHWVHCVILYGQTVMPLKANVWDRKPARSQSSQKMEWLWARYTPLVSVLDGDGQGTQSVGPWGALGEDQLTVSLFTTGFHSVPPTLSLPKPLFISCWSPALPSPTSTWKSCHFCLTSSCLCKCPYLYLKSPLPFLCLQNLSFKV